MLRPSTLRRSLAPVLLLSLVLPLLAACSSGSSGPTAPAATAPVTTGLTVSTSVGTLPLVDHGCGAALALARIGREIDTTALIADRQRDDLCHPGLLAGFEVHARPADQARERCGGNPACFEPVGAGGRLHVICDGGGVEHESAHAVAWAGDLSCWQTVYHSRNFRCEVTDDLYGS